MCIRDRARGVRVTGCTVQLLERGEADGGPIVLQAAVPVEMEDRFTLICLLPFTMSGIGPIWAPWQRRDPSYPSSTSGSVSYTHLDVYKRQSTPCPVRPIPGPPGGRTCLQVFIRPQSARSGHPPDDATLG